MFLVKRDNFNKSIITYGLCTALLFSSFIYLSYFGIENKVINSIFGLLAVYLILTIPKKALFYAGFFIGIFWCWWVALSFQHYNLSYLIPLVILGFGLGYGLFFYVLTLLDNSVYARALMLFGFTFFAPFGFNWVKPELLFIDSYFGISKIDFALILVSMILITLKKYKYIFFFPLLISFFLQPHYELKKNDLKIFMPQLNVQQDIKWEKKFRNTLIDNNLALIDLAISQHYDLIILPETAFPMILNRNKHLLNYLEKQSNQIDIVTGALYQKDDLYYNTTYHISKGIIHVAHKVVLVPFGEAVPLPEKIKHLINDIFYEGAKDYTKALSPTDFDIKGMSFRNAICYEATTDEIFENINETQYMIAISNNAWFTPSIEPTLQKLLMKYYSKKYKVTIYSSVNGSENSIIYP